MREARRPLFPRPGPQRTTPTTSREGGGGGQYDRIAIEQTTSIVVPIVARHRRRPRRRGPSAPTQSRDDVNIIVARRCPPYSHRGRISVPPPLLLSPPHPDVDVDAAWVLVVEDVRSWIGDVATTSCDELAPSSSSLLSSSSGIAAEEERRDRRRRHATSDELASFLRALDDADVGNLRRRPRDDRRRRRRRDVVVGSFDGTNGVRPGVDGGDCGRSRKRRLPSGGVRSIDVMMAMHDDADGANLADDDAPTALSLGNADRDACAGGRRYDRSTSGGV